MLKIIQYPTIDSTMDEAVRLSEQAEGLEFAVLADEQTQGRGRHGRTWVSNKGNLYLSVVTRPVPLELLTQYALLWGVVLRDVISSFLPNQLIQCKWPNDVLLNGFKVAGLLIERSHQPDALVVGVGVNLLHCPEETMFPATCLKAHTAQIPSTIELSKSLIDKYQQYREEWEKHGFSHVRESCLKSLWKLNDEIIISQNTGSVVGIFETIDENGALILKTKSGYERLLVGDLIR